MKQKILLINASYKNKNIIYFPLELGYIAGACAHAGIDVDCLDLNINNLLTDQMLTKIKTQDFHVVGIDNFPTQLKSTIDMSNIMKNFF